MNGLPAGHGIVTGYFGILQDVLTLFLQHINMPALSVAEPNLHTGTLLCIGVSGPLLCQIQIVFQICTEGKAIVRSIAQDLTFSILLVQNTVILRIQNPGFSQGDPEKVTFQNQFGIKILIQINAAANRLIAFFFRL